MAHPSVAPPAGWYPDPEQTQQLCTVSAGLRIAGGVAVLVLVLSGCGDDSVSQEELRQATTEAAKEARQEAERNAELDELRAQVEALRKQQESSSANDSQGGSTTTVIQPGTGGVPGDAESCGSGIFARAGSTSCAFALNVAQDYYSSGSSTFESFSPTTGQAYTMTCIGSAPAVCTGGNSAAVYLP